MNALRRNSRARVIFGTKCLVCNYKNSRDEKRRYRIRGSNDNLSYNKHIDIRQ